MYACHLYHNHLLASIYLSILFLFVLGLCLVAKFITIVVEFFFCLLFFPTYWCAYGIYVPVPAFWRAFIYALRSDLQKFLLVPVLISCGLWVSLALGAIQ